VLYGPFDWSGSGTEYCSWDGPGEPPNCAAHTNEEGGLIQLSHEAGVEVYPSIGGWTLSDHFPKLAADPAARQKFAENCVKLIEDYDFDGIDIDWEYPGYVVHSGTPEDTVNYSLFLQDIRDALDVLGHRKGRFYGLTAALPCGPDLIKNIQIDTVSDILTELNLMTYDFHGSWNAKTGINAPLYDMDASPEFSVHSCVENWKAGGGSPDQINIGLPFYGRSFGGTGITGMGQSFGNSADQATWGEDDGTPQYFNIVKHISSFTSVRDEQTKTQYAYNNAGLVSYDDERAICDKTEYAMDNYLNGYIIWEISGDLLEDLSTPLLDAVNDRLNDPGVRCDPDEVILVGSWYPDRSYGFCVNDGKHVEKFISNDLMFGSAETCCKDFFTFNDDCESFSLDPGSSGKWVEGVSEGDPWYPVQSLKFCLNDGKHMENFISFGSMFGTAKACCNDFYKSDNDCESHSLDPGSSGKWVEGVTPGNPWYKHPTTNRCVNDGDHENYSIQTSQMYSTEDSCCDAHIFDGNCVPESSMKVNEGKWYKAYDGCTMKSPVPDWIKNVYDTAEQCCKKQFQNNYDSCLITPQATTNPPKEPEELKNENEVGASSSWYQDHSVGFCVNDGKHSEKHISLDLVYSSAKACCDVFYKFNNDCESHSLDSGSSGKSIEDVSQGDPWYPVQSLEFCLNDGKHMGNDRMFVSAETCCNDVYTFNNDCESYSLDPGSSGKWVEGVTPGNPWYKHPTINRCVNDGDHGNQFVQTSQMYSNKDSCCDAHYPYDNCGSESSMKVKEGKWYKAKDGCTMKSPVPNWIRNVYGTKEKCCERKFKYSYDSCLATPQATTNPTKAELNLQSPPTVDKSGDSPIKEHAQTYTFLNSNGDDKDMMVERLYYPDFESNSCVNDGNRPKFMAGDYLSDNMSECCNDFYGNNDEILSECIGM